MTDYSFIAYIDESGEMGTNYDGGSSECLVMGAAITPGWHVDLVQDFFAHAHSVDKRVIDIFPKFQKCTEKRKWLLTSMFHLYPIFTVHVGIHKPTLFGSHIGHDMNACYCYLIKLTLERISWWVRDNLHHDDPGNGRCQLVFSENTALSYDAILEYLRKLKKGQGNYNCRIHWKAFTADDIVVNPHTPESGLHLADIAAGGLFTAIDHSKRDYGITDDRYIRNLRRDIVRNDSQVYGIKIFPKDAVSVLGERGVLDFCKIIC